MFINQSHLMSQILKSIVEFSISQLAFHYAELSQEPVLVLQGDQGKFWVVPEKVADALLDMGYQFATQD